MRIGADPLGGASVAYWGEIAARHRLDLTVVNAAVDPRWAFMPLDTDGKIRMDCSSSAAMANLINAMAGGAKYDVATGNDADADRHGIVTPDGGLMNPNHYLAASIAYLFANRPAWGADVAVGKTLVSSSMIDRVVAGLGRRLLEVPVGFKHFVPGLLDGSVGFGGEESAGRRLPAPGRLGLDHRQGRYPAGPAGRRDPGQDGPQRQPALQAAWPTDTARRPTPASTPRPAGRRRPAWARSARPTSAPRRWPASRSPTS